MLFVESKNKKNKLHNKNIYFFINQIEGMLNSLFNFIVKSLVDKNKTRKV